VLTHRASDGVTIPAIPQPDAASSAGVVAETLRSLDPEYEDVLASRLASGKDAKFDFKAQVAAAKAFYPKAKTLLKTFRGVIVDIAGAVEDARRESQGAILEAVVAAEDAVRDRDETSALLAAARAEAMDAAKTSAETAKRACELETKLEASLKRSRSFEEKSKTAAETVETLKKELNASETRSASLGASLEASAERVNDLISQTAPAKAQIDALLLDKASTHETLGTLKGELMSANVQLEAMRSAVKEHESEKARETEKTNLLYADLARVSAEREGANEQLAAAREEAASARAATAEASVMVAETKARALRLEDAAEHAASDLARAKSERDGVEKRLDETAAELARVSTSLAAAEARAEAAERDAATANAANAKETSRLRDELESAKVKNAALEPRVETLNAELAEARADAKVARAESEYLRAAGDEARDRGASSDAERAAAEKHLAELKDVTRDLERKASEAEGRALALRSALDAAEKKTARLEKEAEASDVKLQAYDVDAREASSLRSRLEALRVTHEEQSAALASARSALSDAAAGAAAVSSRAEERETRASSLERRCAALEAASALKDAELRQGAIVRRALHNQVQELKGNIRVFCRVRPINQHSGESVDAAETGAGKDHSEPLLRVARAGESAGRALAVAPPGKKEKPTRFAFDRVFGGDAGQEEVFEDIAHLVQSALDGYKVCIFAYGQTGSGKTYTMLGDDGENAQGDDAKGLIPRCVERIFAARDDGSTSDIRARFDVTATMVEIYNEEIKDLLSDNTDETVKHDVKHDARTGETSVTHAASVAVNSAREIDSLVRRAIAARTTRATKMNDHSSRSHMVFTLNLTGVDASGAPTRGVLNLVDLAGSERLSRTGATGDRLKEAQSINKSLSALGDVIAARAEKAAHVPYRNSKLTYLLQNALGGDAKTLMFANVSPVAESAQETLCSLRFAAKVNACAAGGNK
jgi:kinesin family protein C1